MPYNILCQTCSNRLNNCVDDREALDEGWKTDNDPWIPHWYCPDCEESENS